jgi:hypothetical protein
MMIALGACRLGEYVDGTAIRPILITTATSPSGITATPEKVKENKPSICRRITSSNSTSSGLYRPNDVTNLTPDHRCSDVERDKNAP